MAGTDTQCPRCLQKHRQQFAKLWTQVHESYGKIPKDEWLELKEEAGQLRCDHYSMRENYHGEINEDGVFFLSYSCHCSTCGFNWKHEIETQVDLTPAQ